MSWKDFLKEAGFFCLKSDKVISTEASPFYKEKS